MNTFEQLIVRAFFHAEEVTGINLLDEGWTYRFTAGKRTHGVCNYTRKEIGISKFHCLQNTKEQVYDTVLHEIAHALVGHQHNHNSVWLNMYRRLGGTGGQFITESNIQSKYVLVNLVTKEVVSEYFRKPNERTIQREKTLYIRGKKEETLGKLKYMSRNQFTTAYA